MVQARARGQAGFAVALLLAVAVGRATTPIESSLPLVLPAAGVGALWLLWAICEDAVTLAVAVSGLIATTLLDHLVSGASDAMALIFVDVVLVQCGAVAVGLWWLRRRDEAREVTTDLGSARGAVAVVVLSAAAAGAGVAVGMAGFAWVHGPDAATYDLVWAWWGRTFAGTLLVVAPALLVHEHAVRHDGRALAQAASVVRDRAMELTLLAAATAVALVVLVAGGRSLLVLLALTVWVAQRLAPAAVAVYASATGTALIGVTVLGHGPLAGVPLAQRAVDLQLFVAGLAAIALVLSGAAADNRRLVSRARAAECEAARRAAMFTAVTEALTDGVIVQDFRGTVAASNAAAQAMVLAVPGHPTGMDGAFLQHPDGRPLEPHEQPSAIALCTGHAPPRDLLLHKPGTPPRLLSITAHLLPEVPLTSTSVTPGPGAIISFRDVTTERAERSLPGT